MIDTYRSIRPDHRPYLIRARLERAAAFRTAAMAIGRIFSKTYQRLVCWRLQSTARQQLRALNDRVLKDIGVSRGEIAARVNAAHPCGQAG